MEDESDISITMATSCMNHLMQGFPYVTCGDYMSCIAVLTHSVAKGIAQAMPNTTVEDVTNIIHSQCIQLQMLEKEENDA